MQEDTLALLPEMLLLAGAIVALLAGSFLPRHRQWVATLLAAVAVGASGLAALAAAGGAARTIYESSYAVDVATTATRIIVAIAALLSLALARPRITGSPRETEFAVLVLLASLGTVVLAGAAELLVLAVGYLLASIPLYALAGWGRDARGAEAALKLYLLGALLGITMLLGIAVLFGVGGGTTYAALAAGLPGAPAAAVALGVVATLAGLLFKIGAVPAHFWVPDAVDGATTPAAAFLTTVPKIGGLVAAYRLLVTVPDTVVDWRLLVALLAVASITLGNLAAFTQDRPRRLLAYSTVSQVGYLLMAVAVAGRSEQALAALLFYLAAYAVTNLGAFAVVGALPQHDTLDAYRGLGRRRPALIGALLVCLLGLVGTPPTAVFVGKLTVFSATWDGGMQWLVVVAAINTVASLYYYLRWLAPAFARETASAATGSDGPGGTAVLAAIDTRWATATALVAAVLALALGIAAGPLLEGFAP
ncbi:MAG: NADH-quinone oxidoreductase subunit N [Pseudonocardiaceae bacterium]|nr:NADH-quinone oxidoreductase subunit N [Pseudonocardiaceae bacterium]